MMPHLGGCVSGHCVTDDHDLCAIPGECACPCHRRCARCGQFGHYAADHDDALPEGYMGSL